VYSRIIKFIIALSGLFPILLIFWLEELFQNWKILIVYFDLKHAGAGLLEIFSRHWALILFCILLLLCRTILRNAKTTLPSVTFNAKSIKPADPNFLSVLLSYLAPWFKVLLKTDQDYIYVFGFLLIAFCLALITSESYQYNLSFRLFFGYKNFEVQTTDEITYLVLSKNNLINKKHITQVATLTDYMLINTTDE
jgi:hypothetical protein